MTWMNIKTTTLRESAYISATPTQQATWLKLLAYCCEHENGGTIDGAGGWNDRAWLFGCGVTLDEVKSECDLWSFKPDGSLTVWNYPVEKELEVQAKREAGRKGGQIKHQNARVSSSATSCAKAQLQAEPESASTKRELEIEGEREPEGEGFQGRGFDVSPAPFLADKEPVSSGDLLRLDVEHEKKPKRGPKPKQSTEKSKDPRHHEITSQIKGVWYARKTDPFMFPPAFPKTLDRFLSQCDASAEDFLRIYDEVLGASTLQFASLSKQACDPTFLCQHWNRVISELDNLAEAKRREEQQKRAGFKKSI